MIPHVSYGDVVYRLNVQTWTMRAVEPRGLRELGRIVDPSRPTR
jgi:hypothetical protein